MPRRLSFPAHTPMAVLRDWISGAIAEAFTGPRRLPTLRRPPAEPEPPQPALFEGLPDQRRGEPAVALPEPAPSPVPTRQPPPAGMPLDEVMLAHFAGVIAGPSKLALTRRRRKEERAAAASAAREVEAVAAAPAPEAAPVLVLTMDMGRWMKAHDKDRIDFEPRLGHPHRVASPPFHIHDEEHADPLDEFLGQVVGIDPARALLFRRRFPDIMDGCEVGQRYVALRFWDDAEGQVWSMPVEGEDDGAVLTAIRTTTALYRWSQRGAPQI